MKICSRSILAFMIATCVSASAAPLDEARTLADAGKFDDAIAKLEAAARAGGTDKPAVAVELTRVQIAAGRLISAQQTVERFLRESPNAPQRNAMFLLNARLREAGGNPSDALSLYRTIAEQTPAVPERADALADAARVAAVLGNTPMVDRCLSEFTESFPKDPRTREFLLRLYRQRAAVSDHRGAADAAHQFKAAFPDDPAGAGFTEFSHLAQLNDFKGAVAAFQAERKLPIFTLTPTIVASAIEAMRRDESGYELIEPLAAEFAALTGDLEAQVTAVQALSDVKLAEKAVALGKQILPKVEKTAWMPRVRLSLAEAHAKLKNFDEAEKHTVAIIAADPSNVNAWSRHWEVVSGAKRPEAHAKLLEQTLASLASQKNLTLRLNAQSLISFRLANYASGIRDFDGVVKYSRAFFERDGLSAHGALVIKMAADACFAGLPEATKASEDADAALKAAKLKDRTGNVDPKLPTSATTAATAKQATAQKAIEEVTAKSVAKYESLLPSMEKFFSRTMAWGPSLAAADPAFRPYCQTKPLAAELKKLHEILQRVRDNDLTKASITAFQNRANAGARISGVAVALLPKVLEAGGSLGFEAGNDIIAELARAQQGEKVIAAAKLYFAKYPGATGPLSSLASSAQQLGAPKNREALAMIDEAVAKASGSHLPFDAWTQVRQSAFEIAEQNRLPAEMIAQFKVLTDTYPGASRVHDYRRRIGIAQAAAGDFDAAKKSLLEALAGAKPTGSEPAVLFAIATSFTNAADWTLPLLDEYLAKPKRGPQQGAVQVLRAYVLANDKKDNEGAMKALHAAAERPADLLWNIGPLPWQWADTLVDPIRKAKLEETKPEHIALLRDVTVALGAVQPTWLHDLMLRQAQTGQHFEFAQSVNRITAGQSPNQGAALTTYYLPWSQQLAAIGKPELAGIVLRSGVNYFTGVDPKLRAQASQALFSLSSKHGFPAAEIDERLEWAPLLKSAISFRMGDPAAAWKLFQSNEELFAKHEDKVPADYLRWVSERLLQRDDEASREKAEKVLRRWIIANENSTAVPADEKAKTQLQLADFYFKTMRYDLSRSECTSLMDRFPNTAEAVDAQFRIGECYLNQKMYVDAAKVFEKMAKTKDKLSASRGEFLLGVLAQQRGDADDAKARFRNVMDLAPSSDVADAILYRLSELYGQENRFRDELLLLRSIGLIGSNAKQWHTPGTPLNIVIQDADLGVSRGQSYVPVVVTTSSGDRETVRLESGSAGKGFFRAEIPTELGNAKPGDGVLQVMGSDTITYDYPDEFKKQFTTIAPPRALIRLASDAEFRISATEIKEEEEVTFEERLRRNRQQAGKQAGLEFRQEFRRSNDLKPGNNIYLQVRDADRDVSKEADTVKVLVSAASGSQVTATLTETGPHTGIFEGTLKTVEIAANIYASDRSVNNEAVRAIDNNRKTAWEGLNDGRVPKFIVVDLKQPVKLGELKWANDSGVKDKLPVEYGVQVSADLTEWKTIAATKNFTGATQEQQDRIAAKTEGNSVTAAVKLTGAEGRYVRIFIEKFTGTAPRIAEIEVSDAGGAVLIPTKGEANVAGGESLRLTPSDRITAAYEDEVSIASLGKPRTLTQQLQATYYNGTIDFVAYDFKERKGQTVPDKFVKQVRRVDPGQRVVIRVTDYDADVSDQRDKVKFTLKTSDGKTQTMEATETEPFTGVFTKELDIWSPEHPEGLKLEPGVTLEAAYLDEQNTDPGAPILRTALLQPVAAADAKVAFVRTTTEVDKNARETFQFTSSLDPNAPAIKPVAFRVPLTIEIVDPAAAKDSFSEVKATLTTSGGSTIEVICPLAEVPGSKAALRRAAGAKVSDEALEEGRFVGQIFMNLGDKDSPPTIVLEPGDTRTLVPRRNPAAVQEQELANVVPVLNLNGQDIITVSYKANGKEFKDQARLAVPASIAFTDNGYEKPVSELYIGDKVFLSVKDLTADATPERDSVDVTLTSSRGEKFETKLQETLSHSGEFTGSFVLHPSEKPTAGDDRMEAWFGDAITLTYASKSDSAAKIEKTINVVKGTDGNLLVFEKKYATERVAIESQFRMAEAYFELFKNYRALKQDAQATNALNEGMQILKELSSDFPSKQYEARTDYLLGQFAQELKKFDEAIAYYKRIVQNHSDSPLAPDAQYKLGQCHEEKNDMDAASAEYVTLAYTWPDSPLVANVVVRIAEYFYNKKEYPTAAEVSKKFVERFPTHEWAERMLFRAAQCWFKAEQFPKAAADFDMLVENYPRSTFRPDAIFWAGESFRSANQLESAYRRYKRATWDYPESEAAKFARGKLVTPEMVSIADKDTQTQ